ncbi:peptidase T, partial [candidate division KSB1 bacterium]|nr:peptidase T [candidate division KSB1 bacterium]
MNTPDIEHTCVERLMKYTTYDTQSAEVSETYPSTLKQKELGKVLVKELQEMGLKNAKMDEHGYVTAVLESNMDKKVPAIGLIAHMDTSPDVSGENVKAVIHEKYQGGDIVLSEDPSQIIRSEDTPDLQQQIGNDIITSDGTTLLGADNKAGIAEIFDAVHHLITHPEIKHGKICIAVTPDEEIGGGTTHFDVKAFGADYAYTIDGEGVGGVEDETFCADTVTITVTGRNVHPGYAKGKMVNAIKVMSELVDALPKDRLSPETTEDREGYVHPNSIEGGVEKVKVKFLIRDFTVEGLKKHEKYLEDIARKVIDKHPKTELDFKVTESYRNMKYKINEAPKVMDYAFEAIERSG